MSDFVLKHLALMCMHKNSRGEEYKDVLCFSLLNLSERAGSTIGGAVAGL